MDFANRIDEPGRVQAPLNSPPTPLSSGRRILLALLGLAFFGCGPVSDLVPNAAPGSFTPPPVTLESVRFEGYRGAGRDFQVWASNAKIRTIERLATLKDVRIEFEDTGRGTLEVSADRAELDLQRDDFVLHENVHGSTGSGERFVTSEVRYDPDSRLLVTDEDVSVERGNWTLNGRGMEIDVPGRRLRVLEPQSTGIRQ